MLAVFIETISTGAEVVFGKSMAVSRMLKELREGKITMLLGVPLLFNKLLAGILKGIKEKVIRIIQEIYYFFIDISFSKWYYIKRKKNILLEQVSKDLIGKPVEAGAVPPL